MVIRAADLQVAARVVLLCRWVNSGVAVDLLACLCCFGWVGVRLGECLQVLGIESGTKVLSVGTS